MGADSSFTSDSLVPDTSHPISLGLSLFLCRMGLIIPTLLAMARKKWYRVLRTVQPGCRTQPLGVIFRRTAELAAAVTAKAPGTAGHVLVAQ